MDLTKYTIQGSHDVARMLAKNNLRWIDLRWYYMILFGAIAILTSVLATMDTHRVLEYGQIVLIGYLFNALLILLCHRFMTVLWAQRAITVGQLLLDLLMGSLIIYIQGGIDARTIILYAIPIVAAGFLFSRRSVMYVATASGAAYVGTILLHSIVNTGDIDWVEYAVPVVFYPMVFLVLARIVEFLMTRETSSMRERAYNSFLSLLAHQLKHPASASKAIIDVMQHDETARHTEQTSHYLQLLSGESENQVRLIDNLLEAAPRSEEHLSLDDVNIVVLVEKAAHQAALAHQRTGDLVRESGAGGVVTVKGSAIKLRLVFANLFDNSFRHTADGVAVKYGIRTKGGEVSIDITDDGDGITTEQMKSLSGKFSVGKLQQEGSHHVGGLGLGLYVAQQIITAHGGTLAVQSKKGHGTTVTIQMKGTKQ